MTGSALARDAVGSLFFKAAGAGVAVAVQVLLARVLGVEGYGTYAYVWTWLLVLSALARLGLDVTVVRFGAAYHARQEWGQLRGLLAFATRWSLRLALVIALVMVLVALSLGGLIEDDLRTTLIVGAFALPVFVLLSVQYAALRALRRVVLAVAAEFTLQPLLLGAFVLILAVVLPGDPGGAVAMSAHAAALGVLAIVAAVALARALPAGVREVAAARKSRVWLAVAVPLCFLTLFNFLNAQVDTLMVGSVLGTEQAGLYQAAFRLAGLVQWGLFAVNAAVTPRIAGLYARGEQAELQRVVRTAAAGIAAFALPVAGVLIVAGPWLLRLFGERYTASYPVLVWLVVGQIGNCLAGTVITLMTMTRHEREVAILIGVVLLINVGLNLILIHLYGMTGAAIAVSASMILWNAVLYVRVKRLLGIDPGILSLLRRGDRT